jgi:radical SAM protein (TIGR01212 family)
LISGVCRTVNEYWRRRYGERVQKIPLNADFGCPNRDGTLSVGGCVYCDNDTFNFSPRLPLHEQLRLGIERARKRHRARKFLAYFQTFSNTYGTAEMLYDAYSTIFDFPEVVGLSIGTRPDCVPEENLRVVERFARTHEAWIEYGLESSNDESLRRMNRGHTFADFRDAVLRTAGRGIGIGAHIILGLPWEDERTMLQTARDVASLPVDAIKIHNLYVVRGTALERMVERERLPLMSMRDYIRLAADVLEVLRPEMIVMRLTAECPADALVAPRWCNNKQELLAGIESELRARNSRQGRLHAACQPQALR